MRYGYITENGYLRAFEVDEATGQNPQSYIDAGWKPVDDIEDSRLACDDGYVVKVVPYDAGERISFHYVAVVDKRKIALEMASLKAKLTESDYKIIKCYESTLIGEPLPYDALQLHQERQAMRDQINNLEVQFASLE